MPGSESAHQPCGHERGHISDSRFFGNRYATPESRRIFCDVCRLQRWLDVEVALASCQAELGLIPSEAAEAIADTASVHKLDLEALPAEIAQRGHSLVPLLESLERSCPDDAGEWVHYGATTQDIQDTAQSLEMREALDLVEAGVQRLRSRLLPLAQDHRNDLITGRTHGRAALPTTFGLKVVGWVDELERHAERIQQTRARVLVAQLFGGVGTMAAFGDRGQELLQRFGARLDLGVPRVGWHSSRDRVAEYVTLLAMAAASCARVADEIRTLSSEPLREVEIGWRPDQVGSSTMPHKRNPEACEQIVVLARLARAQVSLALDAMMAQEHERDSRGLRLEWVAVADSTHYALAALGTLDGVLADLRIRSDNMEQNALNAADRICSEALMIALAPHIGKQSAHRLVHELSHDAYNRNRSLSSLAAEEPRVTQHLDAAALRRVFQPSRHLGLASQLVLQVVGDRE